MYLLAGIALILGGVLASATLIIQTKPNAKQLIHRLVLIQGWLGIVLCIWGIWVLVHLLLHLPLPMPLLVTVLATGIVEACLGFLLGFGLIGKYLLSNSAAALSKAEEVRVKLARIQIPLGLGGIVLGLWCMIGTLVF